MGSALSPHSQSQREQPAHKPARERPRLLGAKHLCVHVCVCVHVFPADPHQYCRKNWTSGSCGQKARRLQHDSLRQKLKHVGATHVCKQLSMTARLLQHAENLSITGSPAMLCNTNQGVHPCLGARYVKPGSCFTCMAMSSDAKELRMLLLTLKGYAR